MFGPGHFSPAATGLPGTCQVCGRWPAQPVCPACEARFAAHRSRCPSCAAVLTADTGRCGACQTRREPSALQRCVAVVDYAYPWDSLIARFKFRNEPGWASPLAGLMLRQPSAGELLRSCHLLVPVPVTPRRLAERGYNQAWELAKALLRQASAPPLPALPEALVRVRETADQHALPRAQRLHNLRGAFAAHPQHLPRLAQAHVLLVDDVTTTGATLQAAAQALLLGGAAQVSALVLARTPSDG
jgi:ComF family protein